MPQQRRRGTPAPPPRPVGGSDPFTNLFAQRLVEAFPDGATPAVPQIRVSVKEGFGTHGVHVAISGRDVGRSGGDVTFSVPSLDAVRHLADMLADLVDHLREHGWDASRITLSSGTEIVRYGDR